MTIAKPWPPGTSPQDAVTACVARAVVARIEFEWGLREIGLKPAASRADFC